jgi:hypothetical protein
MAALQRTCDVVYSRANESILSITNTSLPWLSGITTNDIFAGLEAIFGTDVSQNASTHDVRAANFLILQEYWILFVNPGQQPNGNNAQSIFRALLAIPLIIFNDNYLNPYRIEIAGLIDLNLPLEYYVSVELVQTIPRLVIPRWTVVLYMVASLSIYLWCVGGMFYSLFVVRPPTTPFDVLDFVSRVVLNKEEHSLVGMLSQLPFRNAKALREHFQKEALFVREVEAVSPGSNGVGPEIKVKRAGLTRDKKQPMLRKDRRYD